MFLLSFAQEWSDPVFNFTSLLGTKPLTHVVIFIVMIIIVIIIVVVIIIIVVVVTRITIHILTSYITQYPGSILELPVL